jgi:hypothetical protein
MAGRTSTSIGVGVTITILGVATLALFITTVIFFANKRAAEQALNESRTTISQYVSDADRASDAVNRARDAGRSAGNKSAVAYLIDSQQQVMQRATGSRSDTLDDLNKKVDAIKGAAGQNLLSLIRQRDSEIAALTQQLADASAARDRALTDRENEVKRVKGLEDSQKATLAALNAELDKYKDEVDQYRQELNQAKQGMDERVSRIEAAAIETESKLRTDLDALQRDKVLNQSLITRLQDELKGKRVNGANEDALVDAEIIGLDAADSTVIINRGRRDKIVLGQTFAVYAEPTDVRQDDNGNYPEGKATLEVIRIDENTSTARIIRERKGNPVVRGDVVANAIYDPTKTYKFLVYGNFDADGDGRATFEEQSEIRARISSWGGKVLDELTGDTDFLVLGERPVLPPEPAGNAPIESINFWISLRRQALRYDELFSKAQATSIPVLNQNRLYTLTGQR